MTAARLYQRIEYPGLERLMFALAPDRQVPVFDGIHDHLDQAHGDGQAVLGRAILPEVIDNVLDHPAHLTRITWDAPRSMPSHALTSVKSTAKQVTSSLN